MCLDFMAIDMKMILDNLESLVEFNTNKDPVLGSKKTSDVIWQNFPSKHGTLIQKSLLEFIRSVDGWDGKIEFEFITDPTTRNAFVDNLVYNKDLEIAIIFECKRNFKNLSGPYGENIKRYDQICKDYGKDLMKKLGFSQKNRKLFFSIFDAYGKGNKTHYKGIRITRPNDLSKIFPGCLFEAWTSLEHEVAKLLRKNEVSLSMDFKERAESALSFVELEKKMLDDNNNNYKTPDKNKFTKFFGKSYV